MPVCIPSLTWCSVCVEVFQGHRNCSSALCSVVQKTSMRAHSVTDILISSTVLRLSGIVPFILR